MEPSRVDEVVSGVRSQLLIDGDWADAVSGKTFATVNPATEAVLAQVAQAESEDVNRAVQAARAAFADTAPWRRMPPTERGKIIGRIGDLILEHRENSRCWTRWITAKFTMARRVLH